MSLGRWRSSKDLAGLKDFQFDDDDAKLKSVHTGQRGKRFKYHRHWIRAKDSPVPRGINHRGR
jgi:hypothetical protein